MTAGTPCMTFRQRNIAIFTKEPIDGPLWQPRLEHWYGYHRTMGTLPPRYAAMELLEIYDDLGCSLRPYHIFNNMLYFIPDENIRIEITTPSAGLGPGEILRIPPGGNVRVEVDENTEDIITRIYTPVGTLRQVMHGGESSTSWYYSEYPIKGVSDFPIMAYVLRHQKVIFDEEAYRLGVAEVGERAEPTIFLPRIPLQRLFIDYAGFERTIFLLYDHPKETEAFLRVVEETDDEVYRVIARSPLRIINFGDNLHAQLASPPLFEKYILPYYQHRAEELRRAGKYTHAHWDGYVKTLLPYCRETGLDGIEAITPLPQGDVTLEEIKAALGDMVLLDGIPATHFLPQTGYRELEDFVKRILDLFMPNIVLGISDEISPVGDIEKVRLVSEIVDRWA